MSPLPQKSTFDKYVSLGLLHNQTGQVQALGERVSELLLPEALIRAQLAGQKLRA